MSALLLAVCALLAFNVLLVGARAWRGRERRPVRPVSRQELIEIRDEWDWPL